MSEYTPTEADDDVRLVLSRCNEDAKQAYRRILQRMLENRRHWIDRAHQSAHRIKVIRDLMGYSQNGSHQSVVFFEDDATQDFHIKTESGKVYTGRSLSGAIDEAAKALEAQAKD